MITLQAITEDNFLDAFNLKLASGQERFVSHPIRSLAQAYVCRNKCQPFGIYADETMVGYVMTMLSDGVIDVASMTGAACAPLGKTLPDTRKRVIPVCKIGSSDYYFAVSKKRPDLLSELNSALSAIQDEDPFYNQKIAEEYIDLLRTNAFVTPVQEAPIPCSNARTN